MSFRDLLFLCPLKRGLKLKNYQWNEKKGELEISSLIHPIQVFNHMPSLTTLNLHGNFISASSFSRQSKQKTPSLRNFGKISSDHAQNSCFSNLTNLKFLLVSKNRLKHSFNFIYFTVIVLPVGHIS